MRDPQSDVLTLTNAVRAGGAHHAERHYLDYKMGRRRLTDLIKTGDRVSVLGWLPRKDEQGYARQLLLRAPPAFESGRVPLYICPECADLGCGAVTARVSREGEYVIWSDFHHEAPNGEASPVEAVRVMRDFVFEWEPYRLLLWPLG